jgi:hypothetical protein
MQEMNATVFKKKTQFESHIKIQNLKAKLKSTVPVV